MTRVEPVFLVCGFSEDLAECVTLCLSRGRRPGYTMSFIDDYEIPMDLPEASEDLCPLGEVEGSNDALLLYPLVEAELIADIASSEKDGQTIRMCSARPRSLSSRVWSPAIIVSPASASSARRKRTLGSFRR